MISKQVLTCLKIHHVVIFSIVVVDYPTPSEGWGQVPGVTGTLGKANSHFDPTQTGPGTAPPR